MSAAEIASPAETAAASSSELSASSVSAPSAGRDVMFTLARLSPLSWSENAKSAALKVYVVSSSMVTVRFSDVGALATGGCTSPDGSLVSSSYPKPSSEKVT